MNLFWGRNHESIVLVAETPGEVAIAEIIAEDMRANRYAEIRKGERVVGAKYNIVPEGIK